MSVARLESTSGHPCLTGPQPPFAECRAESYDFVGRGTLAGLGLDAATPVPPPDPHRNAMIWVTHDLKEYDRGEPGGPVEMTRMLCFEFDDGSGGSGTARGSRLAAAVIASSPL